MKKLYITVIILVSIMTIRCTSIDVAVSKKVTIKNKLNKIAVFPFDIKGAKWGDEFSDSITHHFFKTGKIDVVEREAIERILKEQKLSMTGLIDTGKAVKIGKMLGANVVIFGRGSSLRKDRDDGKNNNLIDTFSLKAISVETGALLITVRKAPGIAWDLRYRLKYCCSLTLIWNKNDILIESSKYDDIAKQIVKEIIESIQKFKKQTKKHK